MKNNYDDLQRFKEKTQTLDIDFKDMSGQAQEAAEHSKWALIRQLAKEDHQTSLGGGQRIDLPQPQPLRGDEFTAPPPESPARPATLSAQPTTSARSLILDSLSGSSLPAARTAERDPSSLFPPPPPPQKRVAAEPVAVSHPERVRPALTPVTPHSEPERFSALFRSRDSEPSNLPKETLLKPLLEKIALCR
ncbi:cellulose biosynthesis protein BcsO [Pantoea sp. 9140]|uniref:cellulose biosynthesis protein BcsO n=1 Tax=Pantoea sp. 9140 TaxID=1500896 RepID=UPI0005346ACB|nr:cellulose biosynthesis protein BcsO [Pantoea sp. 9140]